VLTLCGVGERISVSADAQLLPPHGRLNRTGRSLGGRTYDEMLLMAIG
jgi:hypothetical protein